MNTSLKYKVMADALRARVESLPCGSRLPSLRALKHRTGYSIQTINTAVSLLEQEGVLIRKHGSGLYVSSKSDTRHIAFCRTTFPSLNIQIKEQGLIQACARRGWTLTTYQFRPDRPDMLDQEVRGDAVVVLPEILNFGYGIAKVLLASKAPLVSLGANYKAQDMDFVTGDDVAALSLILKKLVSLGHRRIAYLNTEPSCYEIDQKLDDFKNLTGVLDLAECPVIECHTQTGQSSDETAAHAMHQFLSTHSKSLPMTAVVSCSSPGSIVAMRVLHEHGWKVPEDCSVVCMQEDPIAPYTVPSLTNLKWDYREWSGECITLIERRLNGEAFDGPQSIKIVPDFNWRESVTKAPMARKPVKHTRARRSTR